jgi:hypothetical protein
MLSYKLAPGTLMHCLVVQFYVSKVWCMIWKFRFDFLSMDAKEYDPCAFNYTINYEQYIKSRSKATFLLLSSKTPIHIHRFPGNSHHRFHLSPHAWDFYEKYTKDAKTPPTCDNLTIKALLITDLLKCLLQYTDVNKCIESTHTSCLSREFICSWGCYAIPNAMLKQGGYR